MTDRSRSIFVGLTFLAAMALTMVGIFYLGKFPAYGGLRQYEVVLHANDANGVVATSRIEFNGMYVGQVTSTWLAPDANGKAIVNIVMKIDPGVNIPRNTTATLVRPPTVGNPYVVLKTAELTSPFLAKDGTAVLDATAGDAGLIPNAVLESLTTLTNNLNIVAKDLHTMLAYAPPDLVEHADPNDPNRPRANATTVIVRLDQTIGSLQKLLTDPTLQGNVRDTLQNISDASAHLKTILTKLDHTIANFDAGVDVATNSFKSIDAAATQIGGVATQANATLVATGKDIDRVAQQLVETMGQLDKSIKQVTDGQGTTGRLINDPRLYESLNDLSKSLKSTVDDLDFLLNKWKDEGVNLKLK